MKLYYQWIEWSYHHQVAKEILPNFNLKIEELIGLDSFEKCWDKLWDDKLLLLATENSYAWPIYPNLYKFNNWNAQIIWEFDLPINHCICSTQSKISEITKVYSHFKALPQCHNYLKEKGILNEEIVSDTAWAAKLISKTKEKWAAAICSEYAANLYGLNILDRNIQDQKDNTTRFIVIKTNNTDIEYSDKKNKTTILFEAKDVKSSLKKCLDVFDKYNINLTKIESLPNIKKAFTYLFWLDFEWNVDDKNVQECLTKLWEQTETLKVIWSY